MITPIIIEREITVVVQDFSSTSTPTSWSIHPSIRGSPDLLGQPHFRKGAVLVVVTIKNMPPSEIMILPGPLLTREKHEKETCGAISSGVALR